MLNIQQFREKYPVYNDLSDKQLVDGLHTKFYSDIPKQDFARRFVLGDAVIAKDVPAPKSKGNIFKRVLEELRPPARKKEPTFMGINLKTLAKGKVGLFETEEQVGLLPGRKTLPETIETAITPIVAPLTIPLNLIVAAGKKDKSKLAAVGRLLTLQPQQGDNIFVGDVLREFGITDKAIDGLLEKIGEPPIATPLNLTDKVGLIADFIGFGKISKITRAALKTKEPKVFYKKAVEQEIKKVQKVKPKLEPKIVELEKPKAITETLKSEAGFARIARESEPQFTGKAKQAWDVMQRSRELSRQQRATTPIKIAQATKRSFVDVSGNIKKKLIKQGGAEGKKVVINHDLVAGSHAHAIRLERLAQNDIYGKMSQLERNHLDAYIEARRSLEILKNKPNFKFQGGLKKENFEEVIRQIPPDLQRKVDVAANKYWAIMDEQIQQLKNEGLLNAEALQALRLSGENYSPRRVLEWIDEGSTTSFGGKLITVPNSGLKKLSEEGSLKLVENNSAVLLSEVINRTQSRIFRNRANRALFDLANDVPENGIVRIAKVVKQTKKGGLVFENAPAGTEKISVMVDGVKREMILPKELAKEWLVRDPMINSNLANWVSWISGAKILRMFATGINPEFAVTNFFRDTAHIWLTTHEFSKILPRAGVQMIDDIGHILGDAIKRKGVWADYIREGGGMEFLTHQGRLSKRKGGIFGTLQDYLAWIGETSEITTRLALRRRAMINGKSPQEATWIARNYLDFSQGGNIAKAVDSGVPYLNAAIQGTRGIFRSAIQKPGSFSFKIGQIGTLASGLYFANKYQNPEAWKQISHREKVNNWIITTPFSYTDKNGEKRYVYTKIAKDQGQRFFATIVENVMAKFAGEEIDTDQLVQSIHDFFPTVPTELMPPTMEAIMGYVSNRDFWKREDIWKRTEPLPFPQSRAEYHRYTHPAFVKAGEITGLSPERLEFALSQVFTRGNIYTSMVGHAWNNLIKDIPRADKERVTEEIILKQPFIRRMARNTDPFFEQQRFLKEIKVKTTVDRLEQNRQLDEISQSFYEGATNITQVRQFIFGQPIEERKRLIERHKRIGRLQLLPEKRWWLELAELPPEVRANVYWNRWRDATKEEKIILQRDLKRVPGIVSRRFLRKFNMLKRLK